MKKATLGKMSVNCMGTISFDMQIEKVMRKSQDFIVYPIQSGDEAVVIRIQSDTRIGNLNLQTGIGAVTPSHANGAYNHHWVMDQIQNKLVEFTVSETDLEVLKLKIASTASEKAGTNGVMYCDNSNAANVLYTTKS